LGTWNATRYRLRYRFNCYQPYLRLIEWRYRDRPDRFIRPDTEIVIEGFGRSASSFAVAALELAQSRPVRSAHHTHAAAQVVKAARLGLPTLLIVKRPEEVALSHMVRHPGLPAATILRAWIRFHETVAPWAGRIEVVGLDELDRDYPAIVARLNERFGTTFAVPPSTPDYADRVRREMWQRHLHQERPDLHFGLPTEERQRAKQALRGRLDDPALAPLLARARRLYDRLVPAA
jgi:hypothetical protein